MSYNDEQMQVINELDNNIYLLASAGTGKTQVLTERIANIIETKRANASEILCITFTNKACKEMQNRIKNKVTIKTFHAFCMQIIKENAKNHTDIFTDFTVIDEEDCKALVGETNNKNFDINILSRYIDKVKNYRMLLDYISDNDEEDYEKVIKTYLSTDNETMREICTRRIKKWNNSGYSYEVDYDAMNALTKYGNVLLNKYNTKLKKSHNLDFNDLVIEAKRLFQNEDIVNRYANKYKYISIDECQDTSLAEYEILEKMFKDNNILLCGDKFQSIYEWRGAVPSRIEEEYIADYNPKIINFSNNYRATKYLTDLSVRFINNAFNRNINMSSCSDVLGEEYELLVGNNVFHETQLINNKIQELYKDKDNNERTCILSRSNAINEELSRALIGLNNNENFEYVLIDEFKFFRREEIKDILAFLRFIVNKNDDVSLKRIAKRFTSGIGEATIKTIESKEYIEAGVKISDYICNCKDEYYGELLEEYKNNDPVIIFDVESTGTDVTEDEIIQIAAIKIDNESNIIDQFVEFIKPNKSVGSSYDVHGFSDDYLKANGKSKEEVFNAFLSYSKDSIIVGHNIQYDINIFTSECIRIGMSKPRFKAIYDTLDIFRRFYPNKINHKLEFLSKEFKINHEPTHNALDDVIATGELLIYSIKNNLLVTEEKRKEYMNVYKNKFSEISLRLNKLIEASEDMRPHEIIDYLLSNFNFDYKDKQDKKISQINKFKSFVRAYSSEEKNNKDALIEVLNITSLSNGELEELIYTTGDKIKIPIITVHQAKGLEYDNVFIAGLEEYKFPNYMAIKSGMEEEEKRAFYVAITRAKKRLFLCRAMVGAKGNTVKESSFIDMLK